MIDGVSKPIHVDLSYPRSSEEDHIIISLSDVRAADELRIEYDFVRNGWVIKQARFGCWEEDELIDEGWTEVAFLKAWAIYEHRQFEVECNGIVASICSLCKADGTWLEGTFICNNGHKNKTALEKEEE